ncbi:hypothetical protein ACHAXR_003635 [Thalassiosira sp. AJA248-18]
MIPLLGYLSQSGPLHPKHGGGVSPPLQSHPSLLPKTINNNSILPPLHPSLSFLLHYSIAISSIFYVHDVYYHTTDYDVDGSTSTTTTIQRQALISKFLFIYTLILFTTRYISSHYSSVGGRIRHYSVLYELTWLCNSTLVMACLSFHGGSSDGGSSIVGNTANAKWWLLSWLFRRRPMVATSCCIAVSIDQILWYVDLLGWITIGKFPIGVMKYLTWEQTLWIDRCTCTHHLWTIPLILYGVKKDDEGTTILTWDSFQLSVYVVVIHVLLSRWLTPHYIHSGSGSGEDKKDPKHYRYLNVNLAHELWRDISFPFLQISIDNPPCWIYLFRLLWRWQLFNGITFVAVLCPMGRLIGAL